MLDSRLVDSAAWIGACILPPTSRVVYPNLVMSLLTCVTFSIRTFLGSGLRIEWLPLGLTLLTRPHCCCLYSRALLLYPSCHGRPIFPLIGSQSPSGPLPLGRTVFSWRWAPWPGMAHWSFASLLGPSLLCSLCSFLTLALLLLAVTVGSASEQFFLSSVWIIKVLAFKINTVPVR